MPQIAIAKNITRRYTTGLQIHKIKYKIYSQLLGYFFDLYVSSSSAIT